MLEIRIHGYGGQGTVTLAELMAFTQLKLGKYVQTLPFFGMERRGAPVKTAMRLSYEDIVLRSQVYRPQLLIVLSEGLAPTALQQGLHDYGVLLVNRTHDQEIVDSSCGRVLPVCSVDAWGIAREHNLILTGQPLINIPMFGASAKLLGLSEEDVVRSIANKWPVGNEPSVQAALQAYKTLRGIEALPFVDEWKGRMPA